MHRSCLQVDHDVTARGGLMLITGTWVLGGINTFFINIHDNLFPHGFICGLTLRTPIAQWYFTLVRKKTICMGWQRPRWAIMTSITKQTEAPLLDLSSKMKVMESKSKANFVKISHCKSWCHARLALCIPWTFQKKKNVLGDFVLSTVKNHL